MAHAALNFSIKSVSIFNVHVRLEFKTTSKEQVRGPKTAAVIFCGPEGARSALISLAGGSGKKLNLSQIRNEAINVSAPPSVFWTE